MPNINDIKNVPASEAIIELRFPAPEDAISNDLFDKIAKTFSDDFPHVKKAMQAYARLDMKPSESQLHSEHSTQQIGIQLRSNEGKDYQCVWFHTDKLLVSNVGEYCGGDRLITLLEKSLKVYQQFFQPKECTRIGMRFINKLEYSIHDLVEKLAILPSLPDLGNVMVNNMLCSLMIADEKLINKANLNYFFNSLKQDENDPSDLLGVIIDIDAYQDSIVDVSWSRLRNCLDEIRVFKNDLFMKSFTDAGWEDLIK